MSEPIPAVVETGGGPALSAQIVHEDPWRKACVLTLDGGGIRGYASLWMLKFLMDKIKVIEENYPGNPHNSSFCPDIPAPEPDEIADEGFSITPSNLGVRRRTLTRDGAQVTSRSGASSSIGAATQRAEGYLPCHYFDYIAGTSTGGLNAIMLGRLRMSVDDCIGRYPTLAKKVFGKKRSMASRLATGAKFNEANLEAAIREIVQSRVPQSSTDSSNLDYHRYSSPGDLCKTIVVANENTEFDTQPYLFRTYPSTEHEADSYQIWEVARATSAADTYFIPISLVSQTSGQNVEFTDGGLGENNPAWLVLDEVLESRSTTNPTEGLSVFISIGTGQKPKKREKVKLTFGRYIVTSSTFGKSLMRTLNRLLRVGVDVERDHRHLMRHFNATGFNQYYRWRGGEEVGGLNMDEWKEKRRLGKPTAEFIEETVTAFMTDPAIQTQLDAAAKVLVARRRARAFWQHDDGLWARYTYCVRVQCPYHATVFCGSQKEVKDHILRDHPSKITPDVNLDALVRNLYVHHPRFPGGPY